MEDATGGSAAEWNQIFGMVNQIAQDIQNQNNGGRGSGSESNITMPPPRTRITAQKT